MKILYIISTPIEYSSSANMRNLSLINGLIKNKCIVDLLSDSYDYDSKYIDKDLCKIKFRKRYYLRKPAIVKTNKDYHGRYLNKIKNNLKELLLKKIQKISVYDNRKVLVNFVKNVMVDEKYDLIISSSDPKSSHLIAEKLISLYPNITKKWIQYWGDPFLADINGKKNILLNKKIKKAEFKILSKADKIVYVSPFTLELQQKIYSSLKEKMCFLPIPYYEEKTFLNIKNKKTTIGYFGDYNSRDRNIMNLYNCCIINNFKLTIIGNSDIKLSSEHKNIVILPRQSKKTIEKYEEKSSLLVCICNKNGTQIPGKIYHYAATNKPILIILDGDYKQTMKKYFESFKRYYICENNVDSIKIAILKILEDDKQFLPLESINCQKIAEKLIE